VEPLPNPTSDDLARRILQSRNFIEVVMVQLRQYRLNGTSDVREVHHPATSLINIPLDVHCNPIGMAVETSALVTARHIGEAVSGLERELLEDLHHGMPRYLCV
jgi:hypothetical protein